jgi:hypothetical protein
MKYEKCTSSRQIFYLKSPALTEKPVAAFFQKTKDQNRNPLTIRLSYQLSDTSRKLCVSLS